MYQCPFYRKLSNQRFYTKEEVDLMNHFRMLWEQHSIWTRSAITRIVLDMPDKELVIERLLRNPVDFEMALKPYYGERIASKFNDLLTEHLVIAAELVEAAKAGENEKAEDAEKRWYENANDIAVFLGNINPYWSTEAWRRMMFQHLALVKREAVAMLTDDYEDSIEVYDEIELQALGMADEMSEGIIKQSGMAMRYL